MSDDLDGVHEIDRQAFCYRCGRTPRHWDGSGQTLKIQNPSAKVVRMVCDEPDCPGYAAALKPAQPGGS